MDFLPQQNRRVSGEPVGTNEPIHAAGKNVVVIGGGDTGSDCIGTSIRQGALKVTQLEILPTPPKAEDKLMTWPNWPLKLRTSSSHEEGAERDFAVMTRAFRGENGVVAALDCVRVDDKMKPISGSEFSLKADLVLLAMGFVSPIREGMLDELEGRARPARQRRRRRQALRRQPAEGLRLRRHAARTIAGRLGDPRGAPMRGGDRRGPDRRDRPAALRRGPARSAPQATLTTRNGLSSPSSRTDTYSPTLKTWSPKR